MKKYQCKSCEEPFIPLPSQIKNYNFYCPDCRREYQRAWRKKRRENGLPVPYGKMPRSYHREYEKKYFQNPENKKRVAENQKRYRNDPVLKDKHAARWITNRAIKSGKLRRKPCEICGVKKVDAHHDDYSKPLSVRWLCRKHHNEHHANAEKVRP